MTRAFAIVATLAAVLVAPGALASEHPQLLPFKGDSSNQASLQRGARNFMNYCSGCHGLKHLRYNRLAKDLEIPEDLLKKNLMFTSEKPGDHILTAIPQAQAAQWFGQAPPDLTLSVRQRGADWVYSYLMSFYLDPKRPSGVNNTVLPNAAMPHVLWELQGWQVKKDEHKADAPKPEGGEQPAPGTPSAEKEHAPPGGHVADVSKPGGHASSEHGSPFELAQPGSLSPEDYQKWVTDLVNFMDYAAEPGKRDRIALGVKVMMYLLVLVLLTWLLKNEYWKDVH
jgi:ubiquinol-cytochrome c reductase cytochrome c1 subunit